MIVRFWGTRGSIPTPGRRTAFFGGNTSCVEVRADDDNVVLLDCGTGARPLGLDIINRRERLPRIDILVTHTHWDHIQGFPFFLPAYVPGSRLTIYGARGLDRTLEGSLSGQMQHTYFPVQLQELRAKIDFVEVAEERFKLGPFRVTTQFLNHTAPTMGYRLDAGSLTVVYATDHEPYGWAPSSGRRPHGLEHPGDARHLEFFAGADLLIHDAQYVDQQYPTKRGWGHSTIEYVTDLAVRGQVKRLALSHHDPLHSDQWVRRETDRARRRAHAQGSSLEIFAAAEGLEINLGEGRPAARGVPLPEGRQRFIAPTGRILIAGADREGVAQVRDALAPDGYRLAATSAARLGGAAASARPNLMVVVDSASQEDLLGRVAHARTQKWAADLPVIVLPNAEGPGASGQLVGGLTDVLSRPFSPSMLRARVRAWLGRKGALALRKAVPLKHRVISPAPAPGKGWMRDLPNRERNAFLEGALHCRFRAGEIIFREGDPPGGVYFIRSGTVRLSVRLPDGSDRVLANAKAGHTVGELAALDHGTRTATAVETTLADYVPQDMFEATLAAAPEASRRLLRLMAARLRATDRLVAELATDSRLRAGTSKRR
jgi:phosphoribosyl 1,2-cyclic phosphodiesterase/CRP-like cAMP-binding protein